MSQKRLFAKRRNNLFIIIISPIKGKRISLVRLSVKVMDDLGTVDFS